MSNRSRRDFLKTTTAAGLGILAAEQGAWAQAKSANEKINFAAIGVGGKGESDTADAARSGNLVAICDVDENILNRAAQKYPNARKYTDFRKMLEEMGKSIDAVTVSTPDHTHAPAAAMAMKMGKHCFCQKPLTHDIYEARTLGELARQHKVATQMGNQGTASGDLRKNAALIRAGILGPVREVHVWTNRPIWEQGVPRPQAETPPTTVHWDEWLGPAPERPYGKGYHTFGWRGWWDFGTGALGDMACHTMNMPFMALDLRHPISVQAETSGHNQDSYPKWSVIGYEFPATEARPALTLFWYDGGKMPSADLLEGQKQESSGALVIGEKGKLYSPGDSGNNRVLLGGVRDVEVSYPQSPGHFEEWVRAIRGGEPAMSNFPGYASPMTETVLLGNLAVWANGKKVEWDAKNLKATNAPEVAHVIRKPYRKGWEL
ncbi:MAG: Gfo/Idh/MocA family protein [Armatimonadota bacterium]